MSLTLHTYFRSSAAYRVRIALNIKGLEYEAVSHHLRKYAHRKPEFLALNPQGLVPVLEHDGQDLTQSLAIIEYLDDIAPTPPLLPDSAHARAIVRSMALTIACEMHPLCNLRVLRYLRQELDRDEAAVKQWYGHWMDAGFTALESMIRRHGSAGHCFGESLTLADVCLVPQVYNATRFECDLDPYPSVQRVAAQLDAEPAFAAARPEAQPDAE